MSNTLESRLAVSPNEVRQMDTNTLRNNFLISNLFEADAINLTLSHYDRYIVGGVMPQNTEVKLSNPDYLKANYFLERREMGIINVGGSGTVLIDGQRYELAFKEALYIGKGARDVSFISSDSANPAKFYINSAPAHHAYPIKKVTKAEAEVVVLGTPETANHRVINKLLVNSVIQTCQHIPMIEGWKCTCILRFLKVRAFVILWVSHRKPGTSGCKMKRL
jgi:4-deoxy-L-threo-5-hexosulose-uronate ketol-isomerase